jgi:hypothetical protein
MDITGTRWSPGGAESILKLRAVHASGGFEEYGAFCMRREHQRVHAARYRGTPGLAA